MKVAIKDIKPNPDNPRTIKDDNFKKLVQSVKDFPEMTEIRPVVVNKDYMILGGNMRYKAMQEAGYKEIEVTVADLTPEQEKEFIIKDNVSGGDWDWDNLANEWDTDLLQDWGLDLPESMQPEEEIVEDEAPEVQDDPVSELGKIYQLGKHRVMCGSATDEDDNNKLFGEVTTDLYLTDPPYNVDYTGKTKDALKIENDKMDDSEFRAFLADSYRRADEHMKEGASFYIFHADSEGYNFRGACFDVDWLMKQCLIWKKQSMVMGRQDYHWQHEPILYGWKSGSAHSWYTDRKQTTILEFDRPSRNAEHPTMKPLNIIAYLIGNSSKSGDVVFDNFLGSGSTLIACEQTDRICYGMEIDPKYVDVIRKRYAKFCYPDTWEEQWQELTPEVR